MSMLARLALPSTPLSLSSGTKESMSPAADGRWPLAVPELLVLSRQDGRGGGDEDRGRVS